MKFKTATGSIYEIDDEQLVVRRMPADGILRRDNGWLELQFMPNIVVGYGVVMALEPLGEGDTTIHTTSPVTEIWW